MPGGRDARSTYRTSARGEFHDSFVIYSSFNFWSHSAHFPSPGLAPLQPNWLWQIERGVVRTRTWSKTGKAITLGYWGQVMWWVNPYVELTPTKLNVQRV
ncbi:MAG: hypothetical protein BRC55_13965 [Cyanobacteria bacterium SW_8_48_13]|nr:MAG: hypothetical protein BRC36_05145 [Cyanobacteria bacterium QH_2_48_84]PSP21756.1 MAG: hypothetical protein BRC55_13965 [Cyanobacteria bacterium SW_8_48_13]